MIVESTKTLSFDFERSTGRSLSLNIFTNMVKDISSIIYACICIQLVVSISGETCEPPPELERSQPCDKEESPFPSGKSVKYCCNVGFRFAGSNRFATCMPHEDGVSLYWDIPDVQCNPVSCLPPDSISNGRVVGSRYTFPNSVKYECKKGYKLRGVNQRYCETTGEWSGRIPHCQIITCPRPDKIENGTVTYSSTEYSSIATYKCALGFSIEGTDKRSCTHEGVWDGDTPTCVEVVCPEPKDPIDGKVTFVNGGRRKDSLISYTCDEGSKLIGESFATCLDDGKWSAETPICGKPCTIPKLGRGRMGTEQWERRNSWKFVEKRPGASVDEGETLLLRCNQNFELPVEELIPGDIEVVCNKGTLKPKPACHPAWCRGPIPDNGKGIPPSPPYNKENGSLIEYEDACLNIGKTLQKKTALCKLGRWIVTEAECEDVRCKAVDLEKNFFVDASDKEFYENGERIEVKCQNRFEQASDIDSILCLDGQWRITHPPCKPASCRYPPPVIDGGQTSVSSGPHGIVVYYRCFPPYELVSREPITCSFGQWAGELPSCVDTRCHTNSLFQYDGVKLENKTFGNKEFYTPSCIDGYDSLEVTLQCNRGEWGSERVNTKFCEPGNCIIPYVAHGQFYVLVIEKVWFAENRYLNRVDENSVFNHNDKLNFICTDERKFQGKFRTGREGIQITCNKKQWIPKPECWFFPQTVTVAPSTTEKPVENRSNLEEAKILVPDDDIDNQTISNNHVRNDSIPDVLAQNVSRNCVVNNRDTHLLIFLDGQITHNNILPHGSSIKFGCQPIGMARLRGHDSANCTDGEWEPKNFPNCHTPSEAKGVVITLSSNKGYDTYPGDVAMVPKHSRVNIICYEVNQKSRPRLHYNTSKWSNYGRDGFNRQYGIVYTYIIIRNMTEEDSGTYHCASGVDYHHITILINENEDPKEIVCPQLNATERLSITYDPRLQKILPDTKASFSCTNAKWELQEIRSITCLETGKWSSDPPICVRRCWPLPNIHNGYKVRDSIQIGSDVIYGCNKGFKLIGRQKLTCNEHGEWSSNVPICSEIRCSVPIKISNGEVYFTSLVFDSEIEYRCRNGYKLIGSNKLLCKDDGKWSHEPPVCEENSSGCSAHHLLDNVPEGVFGGNITGEHMPDGSVVLLVCGGHSQVILGSKYAICSSKGFWKVGDTKCVPGCNTVKKPLNSSLIIEDIKDVYRFGDYLTFSCPEGEELSIDLERIVCLGTGWSEERIPTCIPLKV